MTQVFASRTQGVVVLRVSGRNFDAAAAQIFARVLKEAAGSNMPVVVDLFQVEFADSSGVGILCGLIQRTALAGLVGVSMRLSTCLARAPLDRLPKCHSCVADAISAVRPAVSRSRLRPNPLYVNHDIQPAEVA